VESLCSVFFKIDRIHYFDIHYSIFAFSASFETPAGGVSFPIELAAWAASGGAD
jgi:hypothetical protein